VRYHITVFCHEFVVTLYGSIELKSLKPTVNYCRFFVIAMAIVSGYLVLSLPFSIVAIIRPHATGPRLLLIILDTVISYTC
jgi:hypothetical protein